MKTTTFLKRFAFFAIIQFWFISLATAQEWGSISFGGGTSGMNASGTSITTGKITVETWIYFDGSPSGVVASTLTGSNGFMLGFDGWIKFQVGNAALWINSSTWSGKWTHLACVSNGSTLKAYVNGVEAASAVNTIGYPDALNANLWLGKGSWGNSFTGKIADFRLWSVERSAAEILANYNTKVAVNTTGLYKNFNFAEQTGDNTVNLVEPSGNKGWLVSGSPYTWGYMARIPQNLVVSNKTATGFDLTWGSGWDTGWEVALTDASNVTTYYSNLTSKTKSITGLTAGLYSVKVRTTSPVQTAWSESVSVDVEAQKEWGSISFGGGTSGMNALATSITTGKITVETWIYFDGSPSGVVASTLTGSNGFMLGFDGWIKFQVGNAALWINSSTWSGKWTHLACVSNGSTLKAYVNGVEAASAVNTIGYPDALNANLWLGRGSWGNSFTGKIADFRLWSVERSAAEILANYKTKVAVNTTGLYKNFNFAEQTGDNTVNLVEPSGNKGWLVAPYTWGYMARIPQNLAVSNKTATGFDLTWGSGWDTGWEVALTDASNVTTNYTNLTSKTKSITGLTAGVYSVKVRTTSPVQTAWSSSQNIITASTYTGNGNWSSSTNWSPASVPVSGSNIIVNTGTLTIDQTTVNVGNITLNPGAKLTLSAGKTLNVAGNLIINSDATGTGTYVDNGTTTIVGTSSVKQYLASARNWYMSSPVTGATASAGNTYYKYVEALNNGSTWTTVNTGAGVDVMTGYIVKPTTATTYSFSGTLNTGNKTVSGLTSTATAKTGFNLVGNPYPSYVKWSEVVKTNVGATMWYRTHDGSNYKFYTYHPVDGAGGIGVPSTVTNYIPPMQAFWIKVNAGQTGSLQFLNTSRDHKDGAGSVFRAPKATNSDLKILRLKISDTINDDETVIYFNTNASDNLDAYDSPKMFNNTASIPEIYTQVDSEKLVINGLNELKPNMEIPLGFVSGQANNFSLSLTEISNFEAGTQIILKDKQLNIETNLSGMSVYNFSSEITAASTDRFSLLFRASATSTSIQTEKELSAQVFVNAAKQIEIYAPIDTRVAIYNVVGQKKYDSYLSTNKLLVNKNLSEGIYFVELTKKNTTQTLKVILN